MGLALFLGIAVDLFKVDIVDPGRMNTVFKFYFHAWTLMALGAAYLLWRLRFGALILKGLKWQKLWMAGLAILVVSGMIYPIAATPERSDVRFSSLSPTDDGMAYMQNAVYIDDVDRNGITEDDERLDLGQDYEAILWIQDNIQGSPIILEGNTDLYRWGNRISIYTGLPAVIGWDWHQRQQRWDDQDQVFTRRSDVRTLYSTTDIFTAEQLLRKYNIKYVYVGALEKLYYPEEGINKFSEMESNGILDLVYPGSTDPNSDVSIYQVTS